MKITLIGSTRFERAFKEANRRLTCTGHIVYSVACLSHSEGFQPTEDQAAMYDLTHLAKIVASDAVLVLDVNGYLGKSCKREIAWAQMTGKILSYLSTGAQQINPVADLSDLRVDAGPTGASKHCAHLHTDDGNVGDGGCAAKEWEELVVSEGWSRNAKIRQAGDRLDDEVKRLQHQLAAARRVCEAAALLLQEDGLAAVTSKDGMAGMYGRKRADLREALAALPLPALPKTKGEGT